jgi:1,4-alpha-glucan branching enzyme
MKPQKATHQICRPTLTLLDPFPRDELREYARRLGVSPGRTKSETIYKIWASEDARVTISLGGNYEHATETKREAGRRG